jgi:hypothetical protein
MRYIIALIAALIAISLSDWLLFGVVFHNRYDKTPATWRTVPESRKIAGSMLFALIGTIFLFRLADRFAAHSFSSLCTLTILVWLAASLPQTVTNTLYVNYDVSLVVSHSIGWLARIAIAAAAYGLIVQ